MARFKDTGHVLGQQVCRWIQKGFGAVFTAIPHPIAVDATRVQGNEWIMGHPCTCALPRWSRLEQRWGGARSFQWSDGVLGDSPKVRTNMSRARTCTVFLEL